MELADEFYFLLCEKAKEETAYLKRADDGNKAVEGRALSWEQWPNFTEWPQATPLVSLQSEGVDPFGL